MTLAIPVVDASAQIILPETFKEKLPSLLLLKSLFLKLEERILFPDVLIWGGSVLDPAKPHLFGIKDMAEQEENFWVCYSPAFQALEKQLVCPGIVGKHFQVMRFHTLYEK